MKKGMFLFCCAILISSLSQAGGIKKWVDENGQTHFGDHPPIKTKEVVNIQSGNWRTTGSTSSSRHSAVNQLNTMKAISAPTRQKSNRKFNQRYENELNRRDTGKGFAARKEYEKLKHEKNRINNAMRRGHGDQASLREQLRQVNDEIIMQKGHKPPDRVNIEINN